MERKKERKKIVSIVWLKMKQVYAYGIHLLKEYWVYSSKLSLHEKDRVYTNQQE